MNCPLFFSPFAATTSVEETEHLFQGEFVDSRILRIEPTPDFRVEMHRISVGRSALSFVKHSSAYHVDCGNIDGHDSIIFGFGCGQPSVTSFNGRRITVTEDAAIITRHSNVKHERAAGSCEVVLKCPTQDVQARLQKVLDRSVSRELLFDTSVSLDTGSGAFARSTLYYMMGNIQSDTTLLENPLIAANFEDLILGLILSLPNNYSAELLNPRRNSIAPASVSRAEEYMESNAHLPITITDVLSHTGCSRKSLFSNFRRFREFTPIQFLVSVRLRLAHERLSRPTAADTVTSIAYDSGFSHMGRFTETYLKRYGVRPSQTLRQGQAATS